ncbi:hypothetical protein [Cytobacillus praedii]|uniref:GIY-YIG nuclease family protein n=1 Tax=Cytobacillus praedii TaxID=1742358 RepID=A0A4R1B4B0_9BACI|nr:hypothetical protein [Cytobacillus praedii]MED3571305.1 hypothetical protein [Cytobacillus praedii]TCJ06262.1 hypothetical protein E0Y62_00185 [Cytobacillus praedii]
MQKKEYTEKNLIDWVDIFSTKIVNGLSLTFRKEELDNIRKDDRFVKEIRKDCGIYYFVQENKVKYVGRALPSVGLKSRILNQMNAFGDKEWDCVIKDIHTEIGVIIFNEIEQWHFISALEHYLIEKLERPVFNKRC